MSAISNDKITAQYFTLAPHTNFDDLEESERSIKSFFEKSIEAVFDDLHNFNSSSSSSSYLTNYSSSSRLRGYLIKKVPTGPNRFALVPNAVVAIFGEFAQSSLSTMECVDKQCQTASHIAYARIFKRYMQDPNLAPIVAQFTPPGVLTNQQYAQIAKCLREEVVGMARALGITVTNPREVQLQDLMAQVKPLEAKNFIIFCTALANQICQEQRPDLNKLTGQTDVESAELMRDWMCIDQTALDCIKELDLVGLNLSILPPEIDLLSKLVNLKLNNNRLQYLPPEIGNLAALQFLWLSGNPIQELPSEIGNLAALKSLEIDDDLLLELPPELGNFVAVGQGVWFRSAQLLPNFAMI